MSGEECPVCKDWGPGTFSLYKRGCPRCGADGRDRDLAVWMRVQVEADLAKWVARVAELSAPSRRLGTIFASETEARTTDAAERVSDAQAKLTLLNAYDNALRSGDSGYDYRTGRASEAQALWRALAILSGGYRQRDGWRENWPAPQAFQGN